jgi:hypothetical protein
VIVEDGKAPQKTMTAKYDEGDDFMVNRNDTVKLDFPSQKKPTV